MSGKQQPTSGTIRIGKSVRFGWMSQNLDDLAKKGDWRVLEVLGRYRSTYYIDDKPQSPTQLLEHLGFDRHAALGALWAPTAGIVNPFQLNVALAEDANVNGVSFRFNSRVSGLSRDDGGCWHVSCSTGDVTCRAVVNAAGVHADELHNLVSADRLAITPRRGQYYVLDTTAGNHETHCGRRQRS